jgi:hypothetical protein
MSNFSYGYVPDDNYHPPAKKSKMWILHMFLYPIVFVMGLFVGGIGGAASTSVDEFTIEPQPTIVKPSTTHNTPVRKKPSPVRIGDGIHEVNVDIKPGKYKTSGGDFCYWARLRDLDGSLNSIAANHVGAGLQTVIVKKTDKAFESRACGTWTKVG